MGKDFFDDIDDLDTKEKPVEKRPVKTPKKKKKKSKAGTAVFVIILLACLGIFAFSAYKLISYFWEGHKTMEAFEDLHELIEEDKETNQDRYNRLYAMNHDFIGWVSIEDTNISYPVMYTPEDPEFYLHSNFDKDYEYAGVPFADAKSSFNPNSDNIIIYGHNMKNGTMFSQLTEYEDPEYCKKHNVINFNTIYEDGQYEIYAVLMTSAYGEDEGIGGTFKYYEYIDFADEIDFNEYVSNLDKFKLYDTGVDLEYGDKLITLSTCQYTQVQGRMAVIAKKIQSN